MLLSISPFYYTLEKNYFSQLKRFFQQIRTKYSELNPLFVFLVYPLFYFFFIILLDLPKISTFSTYILFSCIFWNRHNHHHHVVPLARISLNLSRHPSLSFIAFGRSSGLHPVSSHSWCMYVRAGRPAVAWPYAGVHRSTSLMSSSLLLQQCTACLARLTCLVFGMRGKWPYSWCLVGCCR